MAEKQAWCIHLIPWSSEYCRFFSRGVGVEGEPRVVDALEISFVAFLLFPPRVGLREVSLL